MSMTLTQETQIDSISNLFKQNSKQKTLGKVLIDENILKKYDENNEHFTIINDLSGENEEQKFDSIYRNENLKIYLEYFGLNGIWKIKNENLDFKNDIKLKDILEKINSIENISFQQQIYFIINKFDRFFKDLSLENRSISNTENDEQQTNLSRISDSIQGNHLTTTITSHRIRQDSSCSSTNSLRYTEFVPPSTVSIRRRKVIQSIRLQVQRKKKLFEKLGEKLKQTPTEPTMYELGLEFLRLYDGKFNYPQGYTFIISFKNRTWYLTINNIKCVECSLGESEPRSVLILQYKNKFTTVQV